MKLQKKSAIFAENLAISIRNLGKLGKKSYEKFKKVAVRKSHGKGVEAPNFFRIRSQFRGRTTPKMKFLLKNVALPEGGGKISAKIAEIRFFGLLKFLTAKSLQKVLA